MFKLTLILLLSFSTRQALSCGLHEGGPREISFLPGQGDRVLNMQVSSEKGVTEIVEDDTGFFGSFHMVNFLTTEAKTNENHEIDPALYKEQFDFFNERTGKMYLDFSSISEYNGRKEILASIFELNTIAKGALKYKSEEVAQAWRKVLDTLNKYGATPTTRRKKSVEDSFGEIEDLDFRQYYGVIRTRCGGPKSTLKISQRAGKSPAAGEKAAQ